MAELFAQAASMQSGHIPFRIPGDTKEHMIAFAKSLITAMKEWPDLKLYSGTRIGRELSDASQVGTFLSLPGVKNSPEWVIANPVQKLYSFCQSPEFILNEAEAMTSFAHYIANREEFWDHKEELLDWLEISEPETYEKWMDDGEQEASMVQQLVTQAMDQLTGMPSFSGPPLPSSDRSPAEGAAH